MWHRLSLVAEHRHVDEAALTKFAEANSSRFGILGSGADAQVSTFHVDDLLKGFFAHGGVRMPLEEWKERYGYGEAAVRPSLR